MQSVSPKYCPECGQTKTTLEFGRERRQADGLQHWCRPCKNRYVSEWSAGRSRLTERRNSEQVIARFWSHVDRRWSGCWLWTAHINRHTGYGTFRAANRKPWDAHRFIWQALYGSIPEGLEVLHTCDVRACVRPAHLYLGTQSQNVQDMITRGRHRPARGEQAGRAKLTEHAVRRIRDEVLSGVSFASLAREYGVHPVHIANIVRRTVWAHVA